MPATLEYSPNTIGKARDYYFDYALSIPSGITITAAAVEVSGGFTGAGSAQIGTYNKVTRTFAAAAAGTTVAARLTATGLGAWLVSWPVTLSSGETLKKSAVAPVVDARS